MPHSLEPANNKEFLPASLREGKRPPVRRASMFGLIVLFCFFGAFAFWGGLAPLDSAAIAQGSVKIDTNRKSVQHLEGGIVSAIDVREGARVTKGQILIKLDTTRATVQIQLLSGQIASIEQQLNLLKEEIDDVETLLKKGLARKPRLLALHRRRAELLGERKRHHSSMAVARDTIARSIVRAPIAGRVVGLAVHTVGGVIKAGDTLMSIVPSNELLVVEARVDPNDIDIVRAGLKAQVRLTPYGARDLAPLQGSVTWVSADRLVDPKTGAPYFLARVTIDRPNTGMASRVQLYPGMPAEVMIVTGKNTMLGYIFQPIARSFRRAFREQ